jgi:hypothetical protein
MHDDRPPRVEYLDEWDLTQPQDLKRAGNALMLVVSTGVIVVAIVVAIALGGTQRRGVDPVTSPTPTALPNGRATDLSPTSYVSDESATDHQAGVVVTSPAYTRGPFPSDVEVEPLIVTLIDTVSDEADGVIAYRLSVCVSSGSGSVGGGEVRISRGNWHLATYVSGFSGPVADKVVIQPAFPADGMYGEGQCATGYVPFSTGGDNPAYLTYADGRFEWSWSFG